MAKEYTFEQLLQKASSYCSISERCISEADEKLQKWNASDADCEKIIEQLVEKDFINEQRYAEAFVRDKFRFNKWGKMKISFALKMKRIDRQTISNALNQIDEDEYAEMLTSILKTKLKGLKYADEYEKQGKLFRFAQSRGFEYGVIERVLRDVC
jgi:regulatory protein